MRPRIFIMGLSALIACLWISSQSWVARADDIPFDTDVPDAGSPAPPPVSNTAPPPTNTGAPPASHTAPRSVPQPTQASPSSRASNTANTRDKSGPAELAGLGKLAPFSDIAVITKRFLPKTNRFEFFPNLGLVMNDAFFTDLVFGGRLAYAFTEKYALELTYLGISTAQKQVTNELQQLTPNSVNTAALATPQSYYGLDFKWSPVYGKLGYMDQKIVPFDIYLSGGLGITSTNQSTTPTTVHIGAGQLFALQKWLAFRWDISWYGYSSTTTVGTNQGSQFFSNLHATIGMSFFFPSAGYR